MNNLWQIGVSAWVVGVLVGYMLGRLDLLARLLQSSAAGPETYLMASRTLPQRERAQQEAKARVHDITINETKFVAPISTAGMARNEKIELGKTTEIADDINSSVSKLAQLKGK